MRIVSRGGGILRGKKEKEFQLSFLVIENYVTLLLFQNKSEKNPFVMAEQNISFLPGSLFIIYFITVFKFIYLGIIGEITGINYSIYCVCGFYYYII